MKVVVDSEYNVREKKLDLKEKKFLRAGECQSFELHNPVFVGFLVGSGQFSHGLIQFFQSTQFN